MNKSAILSIAIMLAYAVLLSILVHLQFQKYRCSEKQDEVLQVLRCESKYGKTALAVTISFLCVMFIASAASVYLKLKGRS